MAGTEKRSVKLLALKVEGYQIIRTVELDFAAWKSKGLIEIVGANGGGKSSVIEGLSMATGGVKAIKDKSLLEKGFKTEVKLMDGDNEIYMGMKVSEFSKGVKKGDPKFETFIYQKNKDGGINSEPTIDGKKVTASKYVEMLNTPLTFRMNELISKSQTEHKELITDLFAQELNSIGADELVASIKGKLEDRDRKRHDRDRLNGVMAAFEEEGHTEEGLRTLVHIDVDAIKAGISTLNVEKGVRQNNPQATRDSELAKIKEEGADVVAKIRELNSDLESKYTTDLTTYSKAKSKENIAFAPVNSVKASIESVDVPSDIKDQFKATLSQWKNMLSESVANIGEAPKEPVTIDFNSGKPDFPDACPPAFSHLQQDYVKVGSKYSAKKSEPLGDVDVSDIDAKIDIKNKEVEAAEHNNDTLARFTAWLEWTEAKAIYKAEVDVLYNLYTKIDTGVEGLVIAPNITDKCKLEIWLEYNGAHSSKVFKNTKNEYRRLYSYSESQKTIICALLQVARLNKKENPLRFIVIDHHNQTKDSKALLEKICIDNDLKILLAKTDDPELDKLQSDQIAIINGELLA